MVDRHKVNIHADKEEILAAACDYRIGGAPFLFSPRRPLSLRATQEECLPVLEPVSGLEERIILMC
jgi:hypothetical protein